jgi:hypothetical protein
MPGLGAEVVEGRFGVGGHQRDLRALLARSERFGRGHDRLGVRCLDSGEGRDGAAGHAFVLLQLAEDRDCHRPLGSGRRIDPAGQCHEAEDEGQQRSGDPDTHLRTAPHDRTSRGGPRSIGGTFA